MHHQLSQLQAQQRQSALQAFFGILGGVGVRVCMVVAAGVQPIIMLIEESSDVEELMRHGVLAEPANHSPLRTRQLLTNCEKLLVINHTKETFSAIRTLAITW